MARNPRAYIADGHGYDPVTGSFDAGARSGDETEQNSVSVVRAAMVDFLKPYPVDTKDESGSSRSDDPNYKGSPERAAAWGADVFIAIHRDWSGGLQGVFGFWRTSSSKRLADSLYSRCAAAGLRMEPSWHKQRDDLRVLNYFRNTSTESVLFEIGRVGGTDFDEKHEREAVGVALAKGLLDYLGIPLKGGDSSPSKNTPSQEGTDMLSILGLKHGDGIGDPDRTTKMRVKELQRTLNTIAWADKKLTLDGDFGDDTAEALAQTLHGTRAKKGQKQNVVNDWVSELLLRRHGSVMAQRIFQKMIKSLKITAADVDVDAIAAKVMLEVMNEADDRYVEHGERVKIG